MDPDPLRLDQLHGQRPLTDQASARGASFLALQKAVSRALDVGLDGVADEGDVLMDGGSVGDDAVHWERPALAAAFHRHGRLAEVDRYGRAIGEGGPLNGAVIGEVLVGEHLLVADRLVDLAAVAVGLEELRLALLIEIQPQLAGPKQRRSAIQRGHRHLAIGEVGPHVIEVAHAVAPVPCRDHAVVEDELPEGHPALMVDAPLEVALADLLLGIDLHKMPRRPGEEGVVRHHPLLVVQHRRRPGAAVLATHDDPLLADPLEHLRLVLAIGDAVAGVVRGVALDEAHGGMDVQEAGGEGVGLEARRDLVLRPHERRLGAARVPLVATVEVHPTLGALAIGLDADVILEWVDVADVLGGFVHVHVLVVLAGEVAEGVDLADGLGRHGPVDEQPVDAGGLCLTRELKR